MQHARMGALVAVLGAACVVAAGCSSAPAVTCNAGADCASGVCNSDGRCAPVTSPGDDAGNPGDDGGAGDASPGGDAASDAKVPGCTPNQDGTIEAAEVPLQAGLHATFRTATSATVDTAGKAGQGGARDWDFSGALSGDQDVGVDTLSPGGAWYAQSFSGATYAARLSSTSDLLGVFRVGGNQLALQGVVSPASGVTQTNVAYQPEAVAMQFPLKMGSAWNSTSTVSGTANGVAVYYTEAYDSQVDAHGSLKVPFGTFQVLRVRTVLTRTVGVVATVARTFAFVTECFGTVATVTSQPNEPNVEFTSAAEIQRLAP